MYGMSESVTKDVYVREETVVDDSGNVVEQRTVRCKAINREPQFVKLYIDTMKQFNGVREVPTYILLEISKRITYANADGSHQRVHIGKLDKNEMSENYGISISMINKYIRKMVEYGVLFKTEERGTYDVNPWLIARGEWKNISQLRTEFDFINGKWQYVIQSTVEN